MKQVLKLAMQITLIIVIVVFFNLVQSLCIGSDIEYTVMDQDTVTLIANKFGVPVESVLTRNGIANPDLIIVGQILYIPTSSYPPSSDAPTNTTTPVENPNSSENNQAPSGNQTSSENSTISNNNYSYETWTNMNSLDSLLRSASAMTISVNVSNCDSKSLLEAISLSMNKRLLMIRDGSLKKLSFRTDDTPLMALFELLLKYEKAIYKELGNTIIIEEADADVK